jgi:hypothetical protein
MRLFPLRRGQVEMGVHCSGQGEECDGTLELWVGGRRVARSSFRCGAAAGADGCAPQVRVRLPRALVRRVRRGGLVRARAVVTLGGGVAAGGLPVGHNVWIRR